MRIYGESDNPLDDKGRINIPKKFQDMFEGGGFLTRAFNGQSLVFYSQEAWEGVQQFLSALTFTELAGDNVARYISCGTEVRLDGQGRLSIPPTLRRRANLEKEVTLLAMGDKMEIWDTETWLGFDQENLTPESMGNDLKTISARLLAVTG